MATYRSFLYLGRWVDRAIKILRHEHGYCPRCGGILLVRDGKYGRFLACNNYPKCKFTKNFED